MWRLDAALMIEKARMAMKLAVQHGSEATDRVRRVPRVARRYAQAVRAGLDRHVQSIVLFGSQARGDAHRGSDYDFVVVLDRTDRKLREKVSDAGAELLNETNRLCSALIYAPEQWDSVRQSPLGRNIMREGIVL